MGSDRSPVGSRRQDRQRPLGQRPATHRSGSKYKIVNTNIFIPLICQGNQQHLKGSAVIESGGKRKANCAEVVCINTAVTVRGTSRASIAHKAGELDNRIAKHINLQILTRIIAEIMTDIDADRKPTRPASINYIRGHI